MVNLLSEKFKNEYTAVVIMLLQTILMGTTGNVFLQLTDMQHIKVLLVKVKTLHAECFPSDCHQQCEHYYYTLYPLTCLTDENRKHTYLVKEDAAIPCSLFSHQQHSLNNAQKCELLRHLAAKRCWLSRTRQVFKEWCQSVVLFVTHHNCAILTTSVPTSDIPLLKRQKSVWAGQLKQAGFIRSCGQGHNWRHSAY
jgi:hypothetical protein